MWVKTVHIYFSLNHVWHDLTGWNPDGEKEKGERMGQWPLSAYTGKRFIFGDKGPHDETKTWKKTINSKRLSLASASEPSRRVRDICDNSL